MKVTKVGTVLLSLVLFGTRLSAQQDDAKRPCHKPGQPLTFAISFDGPFAKKIDTAGIALFLNTQPSNDQAGFETQMTARSSAATSPGTFEVKLPIGTDTASGDWRVTVFSLSPYVKYEPPNDLETMTVCIDNPNKFIKPKVKVKVLN